MTDAPISAQNLPIVVHAQYVKDASFENPGAPMSLRPAATQPNMDVAINLEVRDIKDERITSLYEVVVQMKVKAMRDNNPLFIAELDYGMAVSLAQVPEHQHHAVLLIEVPKLTFPFVRQILAEMVANGGFPPLYLTPVDFATMYMEKFGRKDGEGVQ